MFLYMFLCPFEDLNYQYHYQYHSVIAPISPLVPVIVTKHLLHKDACTIHRILAPVEPGDDWQHDQLPLDPPARLLGLLMFLTT